MAVHVGRAGKREAASGRGVKLIRARMRQVTDARMRKGGVLYVMTVRQRADSDAATRSARPYVTGRSGGVRSASSLARMVDLGVTRVV